MAMTPIALIFLGFVALLATLGIFMKRQLDRQTKILVTFMAAALWGLFALSAMDVVVRDAAWASASESLDPLMWMGFGMAALTSLYGIYDVFAGLGREAEDTDVESAIGR